MKHMLKRYRVVVALLVLVTVVLAGAAISFRLDLTADKRFTLSKSTLDLLTEADSTITVEVFLTGELPADYKKLSIVFLHIFV